jgi:RNA polymerase sigma-70 factor (ECF subfamily)
LEEKDLSSDKREILETDRQLLERLIHGDKSAFTEIMNRYRSRALNFAYRYLGDFDEAEDAAQDCFVKIYHNRHRFDITKEFEPWFYQILANCCRDRIRKRSRFADFLERFKAEKQSVGYAPEAEMKLNPELFIDALQKLAPAKREIIVLRFSEDLSYEEIAKALGISVGTVMSRLHRAKKDLEKILKNKRINT